MPVEGRGGHHTREVHENVTLGHASLVAIRPRNEFVLFDIQSHLPEHFVHGSQIINYFVLIHPTDKLKGLHNILKLVLVKTT